MSSLEIVNDNPPPPPPPSSSIEEQYHTEREQAKLRHWKESEYAAGLVDPSWANELEKSRREGCCACCRATAAGGIFQEEIDPGCGCNYLSAVVCSRLGAGRVGNMVVLRERFVMVEVDEDDEDDEDGDDDDGREQVDGFVDEEEAASLHQRGGGGGGGGGTKSNNDSNKGNNATMTKKKAKKKRLVRRREFQFVLGPFWPMLLFITYPLIFGVSALTLWSGVPGRPMYVQALWALLTGLLIRSLFNTGFRDPGIMRRRREPPPVPSDDLEEGDGDDGDGGPSSSSRRRLAFRWGNEEGPWRWSDQAQSYRPRNSMFCPDCKVIVEEFDHTCPWTGTAIGKKNMGSFQMFVGLVFVCLIMDIFLLTAASM